MRILYVLNSGKPGGMEKHVYDLVRITRHAGYEVFVWCPEGEIANWFEQEGAEVTRKQINKDIDTDYISDLKKFLITNKIDIVHAHELKAVCNASVAAHQANVKKIITHTHTPISHWRINKVKKFIDTKVYSYLVNKYADTEIALTESVKKVKMKEGIKPEKLVVIPNAIESSYLTIPYSQLAEYKMEIREKYGIHKNDFVFGCVGRLTKEKGHETLIRSFKQFLGAEPFHKIDFKLLIAGGGELKSKLENLAKELEISDKVIITGIFESSDLPKIYSAMDIFVFPSLAEGFGIALIEAMVFQLPVLCSDLEVLAEVGGNDVMYFKAGSFADLALKMCSIYEDVVNDGTLKISLAKKRIEETYSIDKFTENYLKLYEELK